MIDPVGMEILLQPVFKDLMWFSMLIFRFFRANDGEKPHLCIHIFMNGSRAVMETLPFQVHRHAPVSVHTIVSMVYFINLRLNRYFPGIVIRLPMFPVVVIGIGMQFQPPEQPANTKIVLILINESISL